MRIRTIKPEFFRHKLLQSAEKETGLPLRIAFAGLWCACDREGRFKWDPDNLKLDILPYDDIDFSVVLIELERRGFIVKYACPTRHDASVTREYGFVPTFKDHQVINNRESISVLPDPENLDAWGTRGSRVGHASSTRHDASTTRDPRVGTRHGNYQGEKEREKEREKEKEQQPPIVPQTLGDAAAASNKKFETQNQEKAASLTKEQEMILDEYVSLFSKDSPGAYKKTLLDNYRVNPRDELSGWISKIEMYKKKVAEEDKKRLMAEAMKENYEKKAVALKLDEEKSKRQREYESGLWIKYTNNLTTREKKFVDDEVKKIIDASPVLMRDSLAKHPKPLVIQVMSKIEERANYAR